MSRVCELTGKKVMVGDKVRLEQKEQQYLYSEEET